jgi:hypothetical protein
MHGVEESLYKDVHRLLYCMFGLRVRLGYPGFNPDGDVFG